MRKPYDIHRAVDLQRPSHRLPRWMAGTVAGGGFIVFETAPNDALLPEAAEAWIQAAT
jgi:hypothetical protein